MAPEGERTVEAPQSTAGMRRQASGPETVLLQMLIEADGSLLRPRILRHRFPGWAFVVAETVRGWRFEPARQDGEPVATPYFLTVGWQG